MMHTFTQIPVRNRISIQDLLNAAEENNCSEVFSDE